MSGTNGCPFFDIPSTFRRKVGAGPAGLVLALSLLKNGVTVRIIDKAPEFHVGSRGAGMMVSLVLV